MAGIKDHHVIWTTVKNANVNLVDTILNCLTNQNIRMIYILDIIGLLIIMLG